MEDNISIITTSHHITSFCYLKNIFLKYIKIVVKIISHRTTKLDHISTYGYNNHACV